MITRYRLLAERLRAELGVLEQLVDRAEGATQRAAEAPQDAQYFAAAAAFDLHSFYSGVERLLELVATEIDGGQPTGRHWHRDLLAQMALDVSGVRPPVLAAETTAALVEYLNFRHVVRNVYAVQLRSARVIELVNGLRPAFDLARRDLLAFAVFLDGLATADQPS
jgi:hypothetical protein